jgi:hypothetical protein
MVLLGDEAQVDACFGLFRHSAYLDARKVHGLCRTYHRLRNRFGCTRWIFFVRLVMWNLVSMHLEIVLLSVHDRCTVCAKHRLEIIMDTPDGTPT